MKMGRLGTRWQGLLLVALGLVMVFSVARWKGAAPQDTQTVAGAPRSSSEDGRVSSRPSAREGKRVSPEDVPIVTAQDLDTPHLRYESPSGRSLFEFRAPTPLPTPTPPPPTPPVCGSPVLVGPCPPPPPPPTPAPPEISFKFIGSFGPKDAPIAVLVSGDQTLNARGGDTVFDRFILRRVGYESVDVGFVGFPESEVRRVALGQ